MFARSPLPSALAAAALVLSGVACGTGDGDAACGELVGAWSLTSDHLASEAELLGVITSSVDLDVDSAQVTWTFAPDGTFDAYGPARATTTPSTAGLPGQAWTETTRYRRSGRYAVDGDLVVLLEPVTEADGTTRVVRSDYTIERFRRGQYLELRGTHDDGEGLYAQVAAAGLAPGEFFPVGPGYAGTQTIVLGSIGG